MGTATYFSPEQAQGLPVDPRSDLYSLGVVLYELVTGRPPFSGETPLAIAYKHVQDQPAPPSTLMSGLPTSLEAIIMKLLSKRPEDRYASAEDLRADLNRYLAGEPTVAERGLVGAAAMAAAAYGDSATTMQPATTVGAAVPPEEPGEVDEDEEQPRRTWLFIAILVGLLALLGGLLFWFTRSVDDGDLVTVPSVVGLQLERATTLLEDAGLEVAVTREPSEQLEAGLVISQDPDRDEEVDAGSTVQLVVSSGQEVVEVPTLFLLSQTAAEDLLRERGLVPKVTPREVEEGEPGFVVEQNPAAGEEVPPGSEVEIFVTVLAGSVLVPDVTGRPLAQAQAQIQAAGLRFANATEATSATVPAGSVISTDPPGGSSVQRNSVVQIVVSTGVEQVRVPDVVGQTEADARDEIRSRGLVVAVTPQSVPAGDPSAGRVISQDPSGGRDVDRGSTVSIVVGVAAAATTTTTTTTTTSTPP
jgi:serine/threonine-protein kinase